MRGSAIVYLEGELEEKALIQLQLKSAVHMTYCRCATTLEFLLLRHTDLRTESGL
jgi:hypothetical protein